MAALSSKLRSVEGGRVMFWCPGCDCTHQIRINDGSGAGWSYNGNAEAPTFSPSILATSYEWHPPVTGENMAEFKAKPWPQEKINTVCHSFVRDGRIEFLSDCTHALSGQTVYMPDFD